VHWAAAPLAAHSSTIAVARALGPALTPSDGDAVAKTAEAKTRIHAQAAPTSS